MVALNKIDLVADAEAVHQAVTEDVLALAGTFAISDVRVVPVSALLGDNVVERSARTPWYPGPTLLELLETIPAGSGTQEPLRFPVQLVIRPQHGAVDPSYVDYRGYAGHVASGAVTVGDEVVVSPSGRRSTVVGIDRGGASLTWSGPRPAVGDAAARRPARHLPRDLIAGADRAPRPVRQAAAVCAGWRRRRWCR